MKKMYGYKETDIIGLAEYIKGKGNRPLSQVFESYAMKSNKAKGTVRNLYYAMAKCSNSDKDFCDKYLNGNSLSVEKIVEFKKADECELIKKVLLGRKDGRSVRSVIMEMAGGDGKLALRYQNKYRNAVKNKPELVSKIIAEIKGSEGLLGARKNTSLNKPKNIAIEKLIEIIRQEVSSISNNCDCELQRENQQLKEKLSRLEKENIRLTELLGGSKTALKILGITPKQGLPS